MRAKTAMTVTAIALLAIPAAAQAHITLNPKQAPAGDFTELLVRVPNEQDKAATTKVDLKLPPGFIFASYEPRAGWNVKVIKQKLAKPIQTDDGPVSEQVSELIWAGDGSSQGRIGPGQFTDFPLSVQIPGEAGQTLTFKAIQTYSNGDIVRWIGPPNADKPAPRVMVTASSEGGHGSAGTSSGGGSEPTAARADQTASSGSSGSGGASKGLGIAALVVGILGLLAGGAALVMGGRRTRTETRPAPGGAS